MMFKKVVLATMVAAALTGCNSSSNDRSGDNDGGGGGGATLPEITAVFSDARVVEGAAFNCGDGGEGTTSEKGEMTVTSGSVCTMSLDGFPLGITQPVTAQNSIISTMQLTETGQRKSTRSRTDNGEMSYNARISSLLQSIDANDNAYGSIDASDVKGDTIPTDLLTAKDIDEDTFVEKLNKIENISGNNGGSATGGNTVPPSDAEENVRGGYESVAVHMAISKIELLLNSDVTTLNLENELADIKHLLEGSDASNGYHKDALLAILEIAEVLNEPEVAERIDFEGSLFDYQDMLPKVLDFSFNDDATAIFSDLKGTTDDISEVLFKSAQRLVNASEKLSMAMPGESYTLPYEGTESFTYQDSLVVQAYALQAANAIAVMSAYQLGDDKYYVPQTHKIDQLQAYEGWYDNDLNRFVTAPIILEDVESDYVSMDSDPLDFYSNNSVLLTLRRDSKYLNLAKQALTDSVPVMLGIDLERFMPVEEAEEFKAKLNSLDRHLKAENGDSTPLVVNDNDDTFYVNLHAFYNTNTGIDRNAFDISIGDYSCHFDLGTYDIDTSRFFSYPMCAHNESIHDEWGFIWNRFETITQYYDQDRNTWVQQVLAAVPARENTEFTPRQGQITRVIWCDEDDNGNKVACEF